MNGNDFRGKPCAQRNVERCHSLPHRAVSVLPGWHRVSADRTVSSGLNPAGPYMRSMRNNSSPSFPVIFHTSSKLHGAEFSPLFACHNSEMEKKNSSESETKCFLFKKKFCGLQRGCMLLRVPAPTNRIAHVRPGY